MPTPEVSTPKSSRVGTQKLALLASNWLACLVFPCLYLISIFVGASWDTALFRGLIGAVAVRLLGPWLFYLLVDSVFTALTESKTGESEADDS